MEPILKDIEARVNNFPPTTKEMVDRALELLLKGMLIFCSVSITPSLVFVAP
jgi:hypothetical protein